MGLTSKLTAIGDAIRAKTGGTELLTLDAMASEIEGIQAGGGGDIDGVIARTATEYSGSATAIGVYAFHSCSALASINLPAATSIGDYAFAKCSALTSINFPAVTSIGMYAFDGCSVLASADFPAATSIGSSAFNWCANLTSINFPAVTSIGNYAFQWCNKLASADFPAVTSIGGNVFNPCTNLASVVIRQADSVCTLLNTSAFSSTKIGSGTGYIYVPDALVDSYKAATNWSTYADQIKPLSEYVEVSA